MSWLQSYLECLNLVRVANTSDRCSPKMLWVQTSSFDIVSASAANHMRCVSTLLNTG